MKIALFDYIVTLDNAIGKCNLAIVKGLCEEHEFTVFSVEFDNPCPARVRWVRVPALKRPLVALFLTFHVMAAICYLWYRIRTSARFDHVQIVESNVSFGDISYSHFCHGTYLQKHWRDAGATGVRGMLRWMDHWLHAKLEPKTYQRVAHLVTPSRGLMRELSDAYPSAGAKVRIVSNGVDLENWRRPEGFDREKFRTESGVDATDILLAFVALGQYERKGLPILLEALAQARDPRLKILVVGGAPSMAATFRERADRIGLNGNVKFISTRRDIRPFLWSADALALPSHYEVFPLAALEGAAAGLPLLVTQLNGVEEFLRDGKNGLLTQRNVAAVSDCITRFAEIPTERRTEMGRQARFDVEPYGANNFVAGWREFYREVELHG
jgi:glycosyltransferase involved in cell wall biosynthesis